MGCSDGCTPECRGATCPSAMARGRPCTAASEAGRGAGCGIEYFSRSSASSTDWVRSSGRSGVLMAQASGHTSMQRARGKNQRHRPTLSTEPDDHALGRSRGGFTTKLHLVTDGRGLPLAVELSAGQAHESTYAAPVLSSVKIPQPKGRCGRPRTRPEMVQGTRATILPQCAFG